MNAATVIASTTIADTAVATNSTTVTTGYNLNISSVLSATEVANISGDVTLYYRDAATGLDFANSKVMSLDAATNTLSASLDNIQAGQYRKKGAGGNASKLSSKSFIIMNFYMLKNRGCC